MVTINIVAAFFTLKNAIFCFLGFYLKCLVCILYDYKSYITDFLYINRPILFALYPLALTFSLYAMALKLDGNSEHIAHARRKIGLFGYKNAICDGSRTNKIP